MGVVVLPKSLVAKTEAKAADVMADLNAIVTQVNGKLDLENFAESLRNALIPTGTILATARAAAPTGFLLCQGQAVSRTTYAVLFAAIGTTYGVGDGVTTFNLPDLRGRVPVGPDAGAGRVSNAWNPNLLGQGGGHQMLHAHHHPNNGGTSVESAVHAHAVTGFPQTRHEGGGFAYTNWDGVYAGVLTATETAFHTHSLVGTTSDEGAGNQQNMQPFQVCQWIVKT